MTEDPLDLLRGQIDITQVPFSDRGSRLLVFKDRDTDRLHIRLCERWPRLDYVEGHYRRRPPTVKDLALTDKAGQAVPFKVTAAPHCLELDTPLGVFRLVFQTPELLCLLPPAVPCGIRFTMRAERGEVDRRGGRIWGIRHLAYTTDAQIWANQLEPLDGQHIRVALTVDPAPGEAITLNITPRLGFDRRVRGAGAIEEAARRWRAWFHAAPPVAEPHRRMYYYAWWVLRNGLLSPRFHLTREAMVPSKAQYVGVWQWDAVFHALAYRYVDPQLAQDQIRIFLDHQRSDGMLPDCVFDEGVIEHLAYPVEAQVTKPPVAAWGALRIHEVAEDMQFLDEVYGPLARSTEWWFAHNDDDRDGIPQYNHPFSSGADDSPLWDGGLPAESPDLAAYLYVQLESLAEIADLLGLPKEAATWRTRADQLIGRILEHFYDPATGVFWAQRMRDGGHERIAVLTPLNLLPLWTGRLPEEAAARQVALLTDPRRFWTAHPIPTVARDDPAYDPARMWRGPTWININYLFVDALRRSGRSGLARELAERTLALVEGIPDIREYYDPETGTPPPGAAPCYGWSAALYVDLAIRLSRGDL